MYLAIDNSLPVAQHATFPRLSTFELNYFLLDHSQNEDFHHLTGDGGGYRRRYQPATIAPGIETKRSDLVDALLAIPPADSRQLSVDLQQSSRRNQ